jgi:hypothetical protein
MLDGFLTMVSTMGRTGKIGCFVAIAGAQAQARFLVSQCRVFSQAPPETESN